MNLPRSADMNKEVIPKFPTIALTALTCLDRPRRDPSKEAPIIAGMLTNNPQGLRRRGAGIMLVLIVGLAGCRGSGAGGPERYIPTPEQARSALVAVLRSWREGRPAGTIRIDGATVEVSDSYRSPDRPLKSFEVLGPVGSANARGFAVKLGLANPIEEQVVRYLVVGKNPLWVFRLEDYERISHWEHKMEQEDADEDADPPESSDRTPSSLK